MLRRRDDGEEGRPDDAFFSASSMSTGIAEIEAKIRSPEDKTELLRTLIAGLDGPAEAEVERAWLER